MQTILLERDKTDTLKRGLRCESAYNETLIFVFYSV